MASNRRGFIGGLLAGLTLTPAALKALDKAPPQNQVGGEWRQFSVCMGCTVEDWKAHPEQFLEPAMASLDESIPRKQRAIALPEVEGVAFSGEVITKRGLKARMITMYVPYQITCGEDGEPFITDSFVTRLDYACYA